MKYSLAKRILAGVFDYGLVYGLIYAYIMFAGVPNNQGGYTVNGSGALVVPLLWFLYFPVAETYLKQTVGKVIFGLQVTGATQIDPGFVEMVKRRLADVVDFGLFGVPALIAITKTEKGQRLGDLWAQTMIVATEKTTCPHCGETVHLEGKEVVRRYYKCPSCEQAVDMKSG